jgi:hypothetical protein
MDENPYRSLDAVVEPHSAPIPSDAGKRQILDAGYDRPVKFAVAQQFIFGLLAALMLDGGVMAGRMAVAFTIYWLCFFVIALRRPRTPSAVDMALVKWSFPFLAILTAYVR